MKKKKKNNYERYFGKNITRIIYLIACGMLLYGAFNILVGNSYWGAIYCTVGVLPFLFLSHLQVSDKNVDEVVENSVETYLDEKVKGKIIDKKELNPSDFTVFSGFIRDSGEVRFKSCRDGKLRTSKYYVTALSYTKQDCIVSMTTYDLISESYSEIDLIRVKTEEIISFKAEETAFPKGNYFCTFVYERDGEKHNLEFYLPTEDYMVAQLIEKFTSI